MRERADSELLLGVEEMVVDGLGEVWKARAS